MRRLLPLLLLPLLAGCADAVGCSDELIETKRDLAGPLAAFRYVRDCGATTDYVTRVAIGPADRGLGGATTVFVADSNHGEADVDGNSVWVEMHWTAPHQLSIAHAEKANIVIAHPSSQGATITYRATHRIVSAPVH